MFRNNYVQENSLQPFGMKMYLYCYKVYIETSGLKWTLRKLATIKEIDFPNDRLMQITVHKLHKEDENPFK